jgi:YfiH family protein
MIEGTHHAHGNGLRDRVFRPGEERIVITHALGNLRLMSFDGFERYRSMSNVVTTRTGGRSTGAYARLNLAMHVGDDPEAVLQNRALVCQALGIEPETLSFAGQVHGTGVAVLEAAQKGKGAVTDADAVPGADAMVTDTPELPLVVLLADCAAVSFYDPVRNAIGLAHAGWRGTLGRIAQKTVEIMKEAFGSSPSDILAGVSPAIGKGHYEVGEEVLEAYRQEFGPGARALIMEDMDGTCYLDLWAANETQLHSAGLEPENVFVAGMCTACHLDLFYSHRHEGGTTGRFAALVMLHRSTDRSY